MKNLWPDAFEENSQPSAKNLLEEQAKLLIKLTNGIVYAEVSELGKIEAIASSLKNDFLFRFDICGKFLEGYHFNVLKFSHDITLYPIKFRLDEQIAAELGVKQSAVGVFFVEIDSPDKLEEFIARVLRSERVSRVVGSIIRLSK
ncbi:MAG: hypothetical protein ACFCU9_06620 [Cyanophyceae cyanobacterium]